MKELRILAAFILLGITVSPAGAQPEKPAVTIAVGGKASLYYLPLSIAERLGYFADEGLKVEILDFAGGAKSLQAMMGGRAGVVSGGFDHVLVMRARGQKLKAFVLQIATPAISLGVAKKHVASFRSPKDLKGMKIGVTAPGSGTHAFVNHLLASAGLSSDDVSIIGVGSGPGAAAAMQAGHLDAIANIEPTITLLENSGAIQVMVETVTDQRDGAGTKVAECRLGRGGCEDRAAGISAWGPHALPVCVAQNARKLLERRPVSGGRGRGAVQGADRFRTRSQGSEGSESGGFVYQQLRTQGAGEIQVKG